MPWIIDGNNLGGILQPGHQGAEDHESVLQWVKGWMGRRKVTLVFDGSNDADLPNYYGALKLQWAGRRTADDLILSRLSERGGRGWIVVTEDSRLAQSAKSLGAQIRSPRDLVSGQIPSKSSDPKDGDPPVNVEDWVRWFGER